MGPHLRLPGQYSIGYRVSLRGASSRLAYGFLTGYIVGHVVAILYNWFVDLRESGGKALADGRSR